MIMDILKHKKEAKTNFCNLVEDYKIINEEDVVVRKSKRVEYTPYFALQKLKTELKNL